jgi:hypothetical protein
MERFRRCAPALTLLLMAPLVAEVLPGATRFSAIFVLPIETCVWGGGALLIRYVIRRGRLGWLNMLLLALALAIAEECLIQQTSLAPLVIQIKGQVYARALGVNYVYLLWALVYETVFVVFLPVHLVEMIFPKSRGELWIGHAGLVAVGSFFLIGSVLAWYAWTQNARPNVFHVPVFHPPPAAMLVAGAAICILLVAALGPFRAALMPALAPLRTPAPWLLGVAGASWAVLWYGLALLAFGIAPAFPPTVAVAIGLLLTACILFFLPRWTIDAGWQRRHTYAVIFGTMLGSMAAGFVGFLNAAPADLYFKILVDLLAVALMLALGLTARVRSA